jgi:hypothetical protein
VGLETGPFPIPDEPPPVLLKVGRTLSMASSIGVNFQIKIPPTTTANTNNKTFGHAEVSNETMRIKCRCREFNNSCSRQSNLLQQDLLSFLSSSFEVMVRYNTFNSICVLFTSSYKSKNTNERCDKTICFGCFAAGDFPTLAVKAFSRDFFSTRNGERNSEAAKRTGTRFEKWPGSMPNYGLLITPYSSLVSTTYIGPMCLVHCTHLKVFPAV